METSRHTHFRKPALALFLTLLVGLVLLPLTAPKASAAEVTNTIYLGGIEVTQDNKDDILAGSGMPGKASYDPDTKTLTLDGVHIDKGHFERNAFGNIGLDAYSYKNGTMQKSTLTIVLKGENFLEAEASSRDAIGIFFNDNMTATFTGTGTLTVTATTTTTDNVAHGIWMENNAGPICGAKDASSGPTLNIHGDTSAIFTRASAGVSVCVINSGKVTLSSKIDAPVRTESEVKNKKDPDKDSKMVGVNGGSLKVKTDANMAASAVVNHIKSGDGSGMVLLPGSNGGQHKEEAYGTSASYFDGYAYVRGSWIAYGKQGERLIVPGEANGLNPSDPVRTETAPDGSETQAGTYKDPQIDVLGFTENATVYSVDVEWGAMTFQYEKSSWDPETHMKKAGRGWMVYDTGKEEPLPDDTQHAINCVTVTNHSNAGVYAALSYRGENSAQGDYSKITGTFTKKDEDTSTQFDTAGKYLTLSTADSNPGGQGAATVGKVYFLPQDDTAQDPNYTTKDQEIAKWQKIGKITVRITTAQPA